MSARALLAGLSAVTVLVACASATPADPSARGLSPSPSARGLPADPSAGAELRHKIAPGSVKLVLVPFERGTDDLALVLTDASGLAELECSKRAEPGCSASLKAIAKLWHGSKDGWNTGEAVWVGERSPENQPRLPLLLRHPLRGKIDLLAILNPVRPRTSGPSDAPSAPASTMTPTPSASATPSASGSDGSWATVLVRSVSNGDPAGEGQAGESSCNPLADIFNTPDLESIPDTDHPDAPANFTAVFSVVDGTVLTLCAW